MSDGDVRSAKIRLQRRHFLGFGGGLADVEPWLDAKISYANPRKNAVKTSLER